MIRCIEGVMVPKKGTTRENIIKRFIENCHKAGLDVKRVIHCVNIGDGAWRIVANVDMSDAV